MGRHVAPEKFVVGETVALYHGEDRREVKVVEVEGEKVTVELDAGWRMVFAPRADGKHVASGTLESDVMPTIIFHTKPKSRPNTLTRWQREKRSSTPA